MKHNNRGEQDSALLKKNIFIYETVIGVLHKNYEKLDLSSSLNRINMLSALASEMHPGRFVDLRLEKWALFIGDKIWRAQTTLSPKLPVCNVHRRVLHVASETYDVGGHTRLILNIVKGDSDSVHSLIVTRQDQCKVPLWLQIAVESTGGSVMSIAEKKEVDKVAILQQKLTEGFDKVFYHVHPDDGASIAALAATPRPQVMFVNHADHLFWLGSVLSDIVVCYRESALLFSLQRRLAQRALLLPTALNFPCIDYDEREKARRELHIPLDKIVVLTVASSHKFKPDSKYNYFRVVETILNKNPNVLIKIIGVSEEDDLDNLNFKPHDRVELLGKMPEPQLYYKSSDIYLDSMPTASLTSIFEAMYFGCYPILQFSPVSSMKIDEEPAFKGLFFHADCEEELIYSVQEAIDNQMLRKKNAALGSQRIKDNYMGKGWREYLNSLYNATCLNLYCVRKICDDNDINKFEYLQEDLDAARLSTSIQGPSKYVLHRRLHSILKSITLPDLFLIFYKLKKSPDKEARLSFKQIAGLIKNKVLLDSLG